MHTTYSNTQYKNESSTVKWAQWDKTQSRELLFCSYVCALHCAQLLHTILHRTDLIVFPLTLQAKMAEPIEMPFGFRTRMGPRDHVLDGGSDPPIGRDKFWGENGRPMLANTIEPSVCSGDAVLCQITLTTCFQIASCIPEYVLKFCNTNLPHLQY